MKIGELAKRSGVSAHTIRYYERIGLLPYADRDRSGQRDYDAAILDWLAFLGRLKTMGMPIRDMLRYAQLRAQGSGTEAARRDLLEQHRDRVRKHVADLRESLSVLDTKITLYKSTEKRSAADDAPSAPKLRKSPGKRPPRAR